MSSCHVTLTEEELDSFRKYLALWRCGTDALRYIVKRISCDKKSDENWKQYIKNLNLYKEDWEKTMKNFYEDDHDKFNMKECDDFDITFICKLIPYLSDKVEKRGSDPWESKMKADKKESFVEYSLSRLAALRNKIQHEERLRTDETLSSMETLIKSFLKNAQTTFGIDPDEITNKIEEIKLKFQALRMLTNKDFKLVLDVKNRIKFKDRLRSDINRHNVVRLPLGEILEVKLNSVFSPPFLKFQMDGSAKKRITCYELLSSDKDYSFVVGPPGAGKTTLMRVIYDEWIMLKENDPSNFKRLNKFDIVLLIECRKQGSQLTFIRSLKHQFPDTFAGVSEDESIRRAIDKLKVLILFDGYDECNMNSASLINNILDCKWHFNNVKVIFTSRPGPQSALSRKLSEEYRSFQVAEIENVSDKLDKEKYINLYEKALDTENMQKTFIGLDASVTDAMTTPNDLALFAWFFKVKPELVRDWTSDFDVADSLVQVIKEDIIKKAKDDNLEYPNKIATDVLNLVSTLCLTLFTNNKFTLSEEEREIFCLESSRNEILVQVKDKIWQKFLSNIVVSYATGAQKHEYSFYHTSLQEILASKSIVRDFKTMEKTSFSESVRKLTGLEIDRYNRFSNIIKYVILKFNNDGLISKYRELLVDMIKNFPTELYSSYCKEVVRASGNSRTVKMLMFQATSSSNLSSNALTEGNSQLVMIVLEISRQVLVHIAELLATDKDPGATLKEYIATMNDSINFRKIFTKSTFITLDTKTRWDDLDITTLCAIMPLLSDKIASNGTKEFYLRISDNTTFEFWLKRVKDMRNQITHDFRFGLELINDEAEHILLNLLLVSVDTFNFNPHKMRTLMNYVTGQLKPMINKVRTLNELCSWPPEYQ